jgi:hypothetical protein
LPAAALSAEAAVTAYKGLAVVERALRSLIYKRLANNG